MRCHVLNLLKTFFILKDMIMPNKKVANETTSKRVASVAAKLLSSPYSSKAVKTVAASALTQRVAVKKK